MKEALVGFEVAKLAKEKGFDWETRYFYEYDKTVQSIEETDNCFISDFNTFSEDWGISNITNWNSYDFKKDNYLSFTNNPTIYSEYFTICCSAPYQSLLQKWLREKYNIHINMHVEFYPDGINYLWQILVYKEGNTVQECYCDKCTSIYGDNGEYETYEEALETALHEALKLIKL